MTVKATLKQDALDLLKQLIRIESFSKQEDETARLIEQFFNQRDIPVNRKRNNIWAFNRHFNNDLPTVLLNSHHDTVKPNAGWTIDPFLPQIKDGKLFGLGSNDAGGALTSLIAVFLHFYDRQDLPFNLAIAATAEEENSGRNGVESILTDIGDIDLAIVGEPTEMHLAVAEKGLMVLDCLVTGKAGHAARNVGENAIDKAVDIIQWFRTFQYANKSEFLGPVKMTVTMIEAGVQHNIIPDTCKFVVDVRTTDAYSNKEALAIIREHVSCEVTPRSTRLNSSRIAQDHPLAIAARKLGRKTFGSPTTSDQGVIPYPSVKIGPGRSERSHTADEFIYLSELAEGIDIYIELLESYAKNR